MVKKKILLNKIIGYFLFFLSPLLTSAAFGNSVVTIQDEVQSYAAYETQSLMLQLHEKAKGYGLSLNFDQVALAHDIFFGFSIYDRVHEELSVVLQPISIWVSTRAGAGTSTLVKLISEVISPHPNTVSHLHLTKSNWGNDNRVENALSAAYKSRVVILDNFSYFRQVDGEARQNFIPQLLKHYGSETLFIFVDSQNTRSFLTEEEKKYIDFFADGVRLVQHLCRNILVKQ